MIISVAMENNCWPMAPMTRLSHRNIDNWSKRTVLLLLTINYYQQPGKTLFSYKDSAGNDLTTPVTKPK